MSTAQTTIKSRRLSLRFKCNDYPVTYKTEFENGEATLINISTSGAALAGVSLPLSVDEKILLSLELFNTEKPEEIQAIVVRTEEGQYSVQFRGITSEIKREILKFFIQKNRSDNK